MDINKYMQLCEPDLLQTVRYRIEDSVEDIRSILSDISSKLESSRHCQKYRADFENDKNNKNNLSSLLDEFSELADYDGPLGILERLVSDILPL